MGFHRKYLFKYISIISYLLKSCFNKTKSRVILKTMLDDLRTKILFGLEISFKCVPYTILEKLVTQCYDRELIQEQNLDIHKCLFVSQEILNKFKLENMQWVFVNVMTRDSCSLPILHYNRIIVLNSFEESNCLLTSINLFNLCNCNHNCQVLMLRIIKPLIDYKPTITPKASISVMKPRIFNEDTQTLLDRVYYYYFSLPKCVSVGDIFKVDLKRCYPESKYLLNPSNISNIYFKVVDLEGMNKQINLYNCKSNFYIYTTITALTEVKCLTNTYLPMEKEYAINNLTNLSIKNYNDYILDIFPGGMSDNGKLLKSWIKPFIQPRDRGNLKLILFFYCI